ncbi:MAG TPA: exopolysaccharide Pel transporter PelG [Bryobacteraceae bacterium]|nr:exopolysaccharide Pel transporter PelG [Bryobacteraceae bacterium]
MAGIGFELRRLTQRDDLAGMLQGYGYAALTTAGPWLFTILALSAMVALGTPATTPQELATFRGLITYNFAFSLVFTAPVTAATTRRLADYIYQKDVKQAAALMSGSLALVYGIALPLVCPFYLWHLHLNPVITLAAILNFALVSGIWVVSVFLTAVKNYRAVTWSFLVGLAISVAAAAVFAYAWGVEGMLTGFNAGLAFILFTLVARVFAEYPARADQAFAFLEYLRRYWDLVLAALLYSAAVWVDKWIMWWAPGREALTSGLLLNPDYDSAMFMAYLTIVPSMAAFTLSIETGFYEQYLKFYSDIQRHVPYTKIEANHHGLIESLVEGARTFLVLQGSITVTAILLAPKIFIWLGINFRQIGIFRFGVAGAFFHAGFLFLSVILSYFDLRRTQLAASALLLVANALFTIISIRLGFAWYGYGYFLAALVAFGCTFVAVGRAISRLPYHTFVTGNTSIHPV